MDRLRLDDIDARSRELTEECREHIKEFRSHIRRERPELLEAEGGLDRRKVFEGWCIQKIAALQLLIEYQQDAINLLLEQLGEPGS